MLQVLSWRICCFSLSKVLDNIHMGTQRPFSQTSKRAFPPPFSVELPKAAEPLPAAKCFSFALSFPFEHLPAGTLRCLIVSVLCQYYKLHAAVP